MTYIAWEAKNRATTSPTRARKAAEKVAHAEPLLSHEPLPVDPPAETGESKLKRRRTTTKPDGIVAAPLTDRSLLTILADVRPHKTSQIGVQTIQATDSLQLWIRGLDSPNYPCLDQLRVRAAVTKFVDNVADRPDYDVYNQMPNPIDLDVVTRSDDLDDGSIE